MTLPSLLESLTNDEREFIARLDYGNDVGKHRAALDAVIASGGLVDFNEQGCWYPYEVIELGKNCLEEKHEREFAACLGIVLKNIESGHDNSNSLEWIIENQADAISRLSPELRAMITELIDRIINTTSKVVNPTR